MESKSSSMFRESQVNAILKYKSTLEQMSRRNVSLAEALINWIALGYAEEYRDLFYINNS